MSNPHIEVGTWWRNVHTKEVRQVADVTPHGVRLLCSECGGDEPFRWSQFVPNWELAPGPKEEPDLEAIIRRQLERAEQFERIEYNSPPEMQGGWRTVALVLGNILAEAGLE